jgi:DNA repair protein RadD
MSEYSARWYQVESSKALFHSIKEDKSSHPVAVLPTGSGKTFTICETINLYLSEHPTANILILSHVREILEQNHAALENFFGIEIGLYSAGLSSKTIEQITVAGIQSIYKKPEMFQHIDVVIIDECHRIPINSETMYRSLLESLEANYVGLTATPYRLKHGYLWEGEGALFNKCVYDLSSMKNYNRLVEEGFLSPMYGKGTDEKLDAKSEGIRTTAGDYNQKDLSIAFDRESITKAAIKEVMAFDKNRKLGLIFAIDIKHAENIASEILSYGKRVALVHSKMEIDRKEVISKIKNLEYDYVVNVDVLTTGFDVPQIDLIVDLAPTKSPVKHVQKLGRGARVHPDKPNCLILDFAGNVENLGPINCVQVPSQKKKGKGGEPIMKECPECGMLNWAMVKHCENCDYEFQFEEKIKAKASSADVIMKEPVKWLTVTSVAYSIHSKKGATSSLKVEYKCGITTIKEWVTYDHKGFAGHKARNWVKYRLPKNQKKPDNLAELFKISDLLMRPKEIQVNITEKYPKVLDYNF